MIDKLTIAIPIRRRISSLRDCLKMLVTHSKFKHDIVLVLDRPYPQVVDWVEENRNWLENHDIKVVKSPFKEEGLRKDQFGTAHASNFAWKNTKTEWLMVMDDDMYCAKDWDYNFLKRVNDETMIYVPINVRLQKDVNRIAKWGEWNHLTFPHVVSKSELEYYVLESEWLKWSESIQVDDVYIERCSERILCHYLPMVLHKSVFEKSGGFYPEVSRDINFDTKLGKMGYMKTGIRNSFFLHMKELMILDSTQPNFEISDCIRRAEIEKRAEK